MDCPRAGQNGENYGKQHKNVIQSIENIKAENSAVTDMFHEATYSGMAEIGDTPLLTKYGEQNLLICMVPSIMAGQKRSTQYEQRNYQQHQDRAGRV